MSPPDPWKDDREVGRQVQGTVAQASVKVNPCLNSTRSTVTSYLPHFLMFGRQPWLPINFLFLTHKVIGTLRPVDNYVADLIRALKKAFEVAQNMTQMEALRQKKEI